VTFASFSLAESESASQADQPGGAQRATDEERRRTESAEQSAQSGQTSSKDSADQSAPTTAPSLSDPPEGWRAYLRSKKPSAAELAQKLLRLHNAGRYESVIRGIRAALIEGYSEPWMYEVLALSLQIAGHPREEIERVLLSRVDFAATDVSNVLVSAAYLTRFGAYRRALQLYRQASRLDPTRPEPYALALKLAQQEQDLDAIQWATCGIVRHVWTSDYRKWHRMAEVVCEQAARKLQADGKLEQAEEMIRAFREARQCDLLIQLHWAGDADLDLEVEEPWGTRCSVQRPRTSSGGIFVRDGYGPKSENCVEEYVCPVAVPGRYRIHVKYVSGNVVGKRARLTVIRYRGTPREMTRTHTVLLDQPDKVIQVSLKKGRRTRAADVSFRRPRRLGHRRVAGGSLIQKVGRVGAEARRAARRFREAHQSSSSRRASAVGYQPVISILTEGIGMTALAIVSGDRRYVRISVSPTFTTITDVATFSFVRSGGTNPPGGAAVPAQQPATGPTPP